MTIAIIAAMDKELECILRDLEGREDFVVGRRSFYKGTLAGQEIIATICGVGKVEAATTVTLLKARFDVDAVLMSGLAGSLNPSIKIGDIVVGTNYIQHDVDATPNFPRHTIPFVGTADGTAVFPGDELFSRIALTASQTYVACQLREDIPEEILRDFNITDPGCVSGVIASGDQFITDSTKLALIKRAIKTVNGLDALAVDMESAAVAQACESLGIRKFTTIRLISDSGGSFEYLRFRDSIAGAYTAGLVKQFLTQLTLERERLAEMGKALLREATPTPIQEEHKLA